MFARSHAAKLRDGEEMYESGGMTSVAVTATAVTVAGVSLSWVVAGVTVITLATMLLVRYVIKP